MTSCKHTTGTLSGTSNTGLITKAIGTIGFNPSVLLFLLSLLAIWNISIPAYAKGAPDSFAPLVEKLAPSVVNISTTAVKKSNGGDEREFRLPPGSPLEEFFRRFGEEFNRRGPPSPHKNDNGDKPRQKVSSLGSGFIISKDGLIVTNNHVVSGADEIQVRLEDTTTHKATIIGLDSKTDLALLKIEVNHDLPAVRFGDSDKMRVGDWVMAIGSPFGLGGTVTAGILSARSRNINQGPYDDFFQTDAAINRGNSGGPMFNLDGEVIGVNTAIFSPSGGSVGIGFAISSNLVQNVISQLKKYGKTRRGWIGVQIQTVTPEIAEGLGLDEPRGALVSRLTQKGPAEKAGIQAGDVIVSFNNNDVTTMPELPRIVASTEIGSKVPVTVWRDGKEVDVRIVLGHLEDAEEKGLLRSEKPQLRTETPEADILGMSLSEITDEARAEFNLSDTVDGGVLIVDIDSNSLAAEQGLRPGDVIMEAGRKSVTTPQDIMSAIDQAKKRKRKGLLLRIYSGGDIRFVSIPLKD